MGIRAVLIAVVFAGLVAPALARAQSLTLTGLDGSSKTVTAAQLAAMPHVEVMLANEHGPPAPYEGVLVSDLTAMIGAPHGQKLRGPALADVLIVRAEDGYRVALSLAGTDPGLSSERIIVADRKGGQPLDAHEGPFRLVVEGDKRPARSARQVTSLELKAEP